jgi:ubiquinone/menaquinone biosynthesis C-methylase UbiE
MNNFNRIAFYYDFLAQIIFGKKLDEATKSFTKQIHSESSTLILGGGSGKILDNLRHVEQVDFVDSSRKMIEIAKISKHSSVNFIHADFLRHSFKVQYDVIVCPFFLDVFNQSELVEAIRKIKMLLKNGGFLIVVDFQSSRWIHSLLIKAMYLFFGLTTNMSGTKLLSINKSITECDFQCKNKLEWLGGLVFSNIYGKRETLGQSNCH